MTSEESRLLLEWLNNKFSSTGFGYPVDPPSIQRWQDALSGFPTETIRRTCKRVSDYAQPPSLQKFAELCDSDPFNGLIYDPEKAKANTRKLRALIGRQFNGERVIDKIEFHAGMNGCFRKAVDDYNAQIPLFRGSRIDPAYITKDHLRARYQQELDGWTAEQGAVRGHGDTGVREHDPEGVPESEAGVGEE